MPLFPTEITEMPQFILKYFKNAPILIEITEMPQYMRFTEGKSQKCPLFPTEMPQFILKYTKIQKCLMPFVGYTLGPATKCLQLQIKFGYRGRNRPTHCSESIGTIRFSLALLVVPLLSLIG